ncbi:MAG TPA: hypothetical protein HPP51_00840 [Planctomycetes bacterium]|nr:hypothetical protein [Planctomycetota bacterium]
MSQAKVTITYLVPDDYQPGDYAMLCGNSGSGSVDYNNPLSEEKYELFPNRGGARGYGAAPYGHHRYGHAAASNLPGYGHLPYGHHPYGHGDVYIIVEHTITECGEYKFALACFDAAGNLHTGSPEEEALYIHIAPDAPDGLEPNSYDPDTDVLVLDVAA